MMRISCACGLLLSSLLVVVGVASAVEPTFRTDDTTGKLPWFQLVDGQFPPEGSAHALSGELIKVDHPQRQFVIRGDRNDKQNRVKFDLPIAASMLPYGAIYYNGALASLADIPLGTHLHGQFYQKSKADTSKPYKQEGRHTSDDVKFTRCLRLEDDFSHYAALNQLWHIDDVNLADMKLTATLRSRGEPVGSAQTFSLLRTTRVWKGRGFESLPQLESGQLVLFNITWATMYGPGRIREIWIDEASRNFATEHQTEKHRLYIRQRGLPGWIDAVDNATRTLTITLFAGVDPVLLKELPRGMSAGLAVATPALMMYDPVNDRKGGKVLLVSKLPSQPGSSGVQIQVQVEQLLEGFRPGHILRIYPGDWPVIALPVEENVGLMQ